jgi:hypothetical protein
MIHHPIIMTVCKSLFVFFLCSHFLCSHFLCSCRMCGPIVDEFRGVIWKGVEATVTMVKQRYEHQQELVKSLQLTQILEGNFMNLWDMFLHEMIHLLCCGAGCFTTLSDTI